MHVVIDWDGKLHKVFKSVIFDFSFRLIQPSCVVPSCTTKTFSNLALPAQCYNNWLSNVFTFALWSCGHFYIRWTLHTLPSYSSSMTKLLNFETLDPYRTWIWWRSKWIFCDKNTYVGSPSIQIAEQQRNKAPHGNKVYAFCTSSSSFISHYITLRHTVSLGISRSSHPRALHLSRLDKHSSISFFSIHVPYISKNEVSIGGSFHCSFHRLCLW